jgi:hypothetical protein
MYHNAVLMMSSSFLRKVRDSWKLSTNHYISGSQTKLFSLRQISIAFFPCHKLQICERYIESLTGCVLQITNFVLLLFEIYFRKDVTECKYKFKIHGENRENAID